MTGRTIAGIGCCVSFAALVAAAAMTARCPAERPAVPQRPSLKDTTPMPECGPGVVPPCWSWRMDEHGTGVTPTCAPEIREYYRALHACFDSCGCSDCTSVEYDNARYAMRRCAGLEPK